MLSFPVLTGPPATLGRPGPEHIGAGNESISVLARIALRRTRAKNGRVRTLRIVAWLVALATVASVAVGALQSFGVFVTTSDTPPAAIVPLVALAVLAPNEVGISIATIQPRNVSACLLLIGA